MARLIPRRLRVSHPRVLLVATAVVVSGTVLAACGNQGLDLARQACGHIERSIALLHEANATHDAATAGKLRQQAYVQLLDAVPISAEAAYHDGQWQALMTTLSQSSAVPEPTLVPAMQAECKVATSSVFNQAPPPSSIPSPTSIPPPASGP